MDVSQHLFCYTGKSVISDVVKTFFKNLSNISFVNVSIVFVFNIERIKIC